MPIRTDLAIESREMFAEEITGVETAARDSDGITITHVNIKTKEGAERIGKPIGSYVTIEIDDMTAGLGIEGRSADAVSDELKKLLSDKDTSSVLVVGLGNQYITPDAIGPKTVSKIEVTRHITREAQLGFDFEIKPVSAVAPGVLGITGIETGEIVKGVVEHVKPSLVIAIDALAARKIKRLGTTVQLSDTGISPGSGVGNNRKEISEKTLGVPVIAIGVPMVVDAATLTIDIMESVSNFVKEKTGNAVGKFGSSLSPSEYALISEALSGSGDNMIVTPNDVDAICEQATDIIADGINMALHS